MGVVLSSCEDEIKDYKYLEKDSRLVVNGILVADSSFTLNITESLGILEDDLYKYVDNVEFEILENDVSLISNISVDTGYYFSDILPLPGATYTIRLRHDDFLDCETKINIPEKPEILKTEYIGRAQEGFMFNITVNDNLETNDYYTLSAYFIDGYFEGDGTVITDTIFTGPRYLEINTSDFNAITGLYNSLVYQYNYEEGDFISGDKILFSDNYISGNNLQFKVILSNFNFSVYAGTPLYFILEAVNEDYVKFAKSMRKYNLIRDNPIAEKVYIYSNIEGGFGLVYGKSLTKDNLFLPRDFYNQ